MTAYLESVLNNALDAPDGPLLVTILGGCALAALVLVLVAIVRPEDGYIENPMPEGWTMPKREID